MNTKPFDLVIFDSDGVLVNSEPLANRVFFQIVPKNESKMDEDKYLNKFADMIRRSTSRQLRRI